MTRALLIWAAIIAACMLLAGCARFDTNHYYGKGGGTGPIHCKGACP